MSDHYEEWAAETLSYAKDTDTESSWREFFEEVASELLSLANLVRTTPQVIYATAAQMVQIRHVRA